MFCQITSGRLGLCGSNLKTTILKNKQTCTLLVYMKFTRVKKYMNNNFLHFNFNSLIINIACFTQTRLKKKLTLWLFEFTGYTLRVIQCLGFVSQIFVQVLVKLWPALTFHDACFFAYHHVVKLFYTPLSQKNYHTPKMVWKGYGYPLKFSERV